MQRTLLNGLKSFGICHLGWRARALHAAKFDFVSAYDFRLITITRSKVVQTNLPLLIYSDGTHLSL
ncbi:MAG TPA: hypothetical protein VK633_13735 [Verrucomicrobiae bacterium]|nr:hypothetical protein [Verrucomicrobiae bacterium]